MEFCCGASPKRPMIARESGLFGHEGEWRKRMRMVSLNWRFAWLVVFGFVAPAVAQTEVILFGLTNSWRYNQTVSYDGTNWTAPSFNDSALPSGRGVLEIGRASCRERG